ncbi:MAG: ATP-dependent zinc metalloprotease FtsH [Planctomycetota bacterium]
MPEDGPSKSPNQQPGGPNRPQGQPPQPRLNRGAVGWLFLFGLLLMLLLMVQFGSPAYRTIEWQDFVAYYEENALETVKIDERAIIGEPRPEAAERDEDLAGPVAVTFQQQSREYWVGQVNDLTGGSFTESPGPPWWMTFIFSPLLWMLLIFLLIYFVFIRAVRGAGGGGGMLGSFGKSRHRVLAKESTGITFEDVAGISDAKEEVQELVEFLKHPKKFMKLGGRIPRGVLLVGDPGCGKTLLAKAIAGEADVPFFSISGSDFVEMFVGVGASCVRDLFKQAKESAPCIIFLDEIDAVGRRRGGGFSSGGHDEREQTLNAILVEMDGFDSSDQVIVIAATNRSDVLDPALTRPGRFDRQVVVPLPDLKGRLEILRVHAEKIKLGPNVDMERIARGTPMFSGAELAAVVNESAIIATLAEKEHVEQDDLEEARDKVRYGRSSKSRTLEERERRATAFHEAGHAVLQMLLPDSDPLHKVTIIPRGHALGATMSLPEKDRYGYGLRWLSAQMRVVCGGRIAEQRETSDISSGAAMDIQQLTMMARSMVLEWGMSEKLGFVRYAGTDNREALVHEREYSEETARLIDEEIRRYADEAYRDAEGMLGDAWHQVIAVAEALLKHETLTAEEVRTLMDGKPLDKPTVSDLLAAEAKKDRPTPTPRAEPDTGDELGPGVMPSPA